MRKYLSWLLFYTLVLYVALAIILPAVTNSGYLILEVEIPPYYAHEFNA